ncbi:MAG: hypothetical protein ORO03_11150, partial [Alphaproteobacteria bacterium]|nr:hypothetical protein [Alphaproteobacteria bacterium]
MSLRTIILSIVFGVAASQFFLLPLDGGMTGPGLFGREVLLLLSSLPIFLSILGFGQLAGLLTIGVAVLLNFLLSGSWVLAVFSLLNCLPPLVLGTVALLHKITTEDGAA